MIFGTKNRKKNAKGRLNDPELLLNIIDNLPVSIFVKDKDLRFVYSNLWHSGIAGRTEAELIGKSDLDFFSSDVVQTFIANDKSVIESGKTLEVEELAKRMDGGGTAVLTRKARHIASDGEPFLIGTNTDLTEIWQREDQLRQLTNAVPVGIVQVQSDGSVQFSNPLALSLLGVDECPKTWGHIRGLLADVPDSMPGQPGKFETALTTGNADKSLLAISSGWQETKVGDITSAVISLVDITQMSRLRHEVEQQSLKISKVNARTQDSISEIGLNTASLNSSATTLSRQTDSQMAALQSISAAVSQLTSAVKQNSASSVAASRLSAEATRVAEEGNAMAASTVESMQAIMQSTQKVVSIVDLIQEIAFQTNLLALNAAVEAARAGEAGKGFAVVASEVRTLAQRSAQALKDAKRHIDESNAQIQQGGKLVEAVGAKLSEIAHSTRKANEIVSDIAGASHEQAAGVQQVDVSVGQLERAAQLNSELVEKFMDDVSAVDRAIVALSGLTDEANDIQREAA